MDETDSIKEYTWSTIPPNSLKGRIVQISLDRYELAGPHIFIPPVLVCDSVFGTHKKTGFSKISFLGVPLGESEGAPATDSSFPNMSVISFYNSEPDLQPQFLISDDFIRYLNRYHYRVPVRVFWSSDSRRAFRRGEEADSDAFAYVSWGIVQLFKPGIGYEQPWNEKDPWIDRLLKSEKMLLQQHSHG